MHVIVGQGQLDSILHATPEDRRGFIEEAAGVLKHRKRKEKALRKLDATRGQPDPPQPTCSTSCAASSSRWAGRPRWPAGRRGCRPPPATPGPGCSPTTWSRARAALRAGAGRRVRPARAPRARSRPSWRGAGQPEAELEAALREDLPALARAQETWFGLTGLRERLRGTRSLAAERVRNGAGWPPTRSGTGRDPVELEAEAAQLREPGARDGAEVERHRAPWTQAVAARQRAEDAAAEEDRRVAGLLRAAADRREGLARLSGQVNSLRVAGAAADEEIGRLTQAREDALARAARAQHDFTALETRIAGLDAGERGLDAEHEAAAPQLGDLEERLAKLHVDVQHAERERAALEARKDALELGLRRQDGAGALLAASDCGDRPARLGGRPAVRADRLRDGGRRPHWAGGRRGRASRTPTPRWPPSSTSRSADLGRAGLVRRAARRSTDRRLAGAARRRVYAVDVVELPRHPASGAGAGCSYKVAVVDDLDRGARPGRRRCPTWSP